MKFRSWRESRECLSDDEKSRCKTKRRKSLLCQSVNWNWLQERQFTETVESISQMSVALPGISSSSVASYDELNSALEGFRRSDLLDINIQALQHEGLIRILRPNKFPDMTVDIRRLRLNMAVVNTWNDAWIKLPKEGFIDKKRRMRRVWRCIPSRQSDISIARSIAYAQTVINPPETFSTQVSVNDDTSIKLNQLNLNSDSGNDDQELVNKMSSLSCNKQSWNQKDHYDKEIDELSAGINMIINDGMVDQINGKINNLKIEEVGNEKTNEITVNPFR